MISMKDIAAKCGVSVATVSRALNHHKVVLQELDQRVKIKFSEEKRRNDYEGFLGEYVETQSTCGNGITSFLDFVVFYYLSNFLPLI